MLGLDKFQLIEANTFEVEAPAAQASDASTHEVAAATTVVSPVRGSTKCTRTSPSERERKMSWKESTSGAIFKNPIPQEEEAVDDEDQTSRLRPHTFHPSWSIGPIIRIEGEVSTTSAIAKEPNPSTALEATQEIQVETMAPVETSSGDVSATVVVEAVTAT